MHGSQPLMEAGLDSLGAVELRNNLEQAFHVGLPATLTFDYPTITALADYLAAATGEPHDSVLPATPRAEGLPVSANVARDVRDIVTAMLGPNIDEDQVCHDSS